MADIFDLTDTWNDGATDFNAIKINVTDTASGAGSKLLDLQVGGSSTFDVRKNGDVRIKGVDSQGAFLISTTSFRPGALGIGTNFAGNNSLALGSSSSNINVGAWGSQGIKVSSGAFFSWVSGAMATAPDLAIYRDAANTLAQRNGTNAQTFNIYNTYTDASNYERGFARWNASVFEIGTEAAGTGSAQDLKIMTRSDTYAQLQNAGAGSEIILSGADGVELRHNNQLKVKIEQDYVVGSANYDMGVPGVSDLGFSAYVIDERSIDPADPAEGQSVMWQSDGTGTGDDGDILIKVTAGGVTKTATLVDFSAV